MEEKPTSIWLTFPPDTYLRYAPGKGIWALFVEGLGTRSKQKNELMLEIVDLSTDVDTIDKGKGYNYIRVSEAPEAAALLADYLSKYPDNMKLKVD